MPSKSGQRKMPTLEPTVILTLTPTTTPMPSPTPTGTTMSTSTDATPPTTMSTFTRRRAYNGAMQLPTDRALAVVRRMPPEERRMIRDIFEWILSTDSVWLEPRCWTVPAIELDVALRLVAARGY